MANNVLARIAAHKQQEVEARKREKPLETWQAQVTPCQPEQLEAAFRRTDVPIRLMLEIKPASPSMGVMQAQPDLNALVKA
ncbi:MAG TPA: hypothetical protein V6C99_12165, partial [Oculatellaceae cyanobacterium]